MFPESIVTARVVGKILRIKNLRVNPDDEHLFVIGSIEDPNSTPRRPANFLHL